MNIYTIAVPGQSPVDVQGISIRTETVSVQVPPSLPAYFTIWAWEIQSNGAWVQRQSAPMLSWAVPVISQTYSHMYLGQSQCWTSWTGRNQFGQTISDYWAFTRQVCGTAYFTPGNTTVNRCDVVVTVDSLGNEMRINGVNGQPCPTWTTRSVNDCGDTEIRCEDLSDPRGFCCIPCDLLNSKIRALI